MQSPEPERPSERMSLASRRAMWAAVGLGVAMVGWFLVERTPRLRTGQVAWTDQAFQLALVLTPIVVGGLLALGLARRQPAMNSLPFSLVVTISAILADGLLFAAVGAVRTGSVNPLEWAIAFVFVTLAHFVIPGWLPFSIGWLLFYLLDRWDVRRTAARRVG